MTAPADTAHDRRQRRLLIGVGLMFFAPLGLAFFLYYGHGGWHPGGSVNAGTLIVPARPLPEAALPRLRIDPAAPAPADTAANFLKGRWTFLYVQQGACDAACSRHLYDTRQVRLALDREMNRVQRVFIGETNCCDLKALHAAHPDLILLALSAADTPLIEELPPAGKAGAAGIANAQITYLIDPLGNLMMSYAPDAKPKGMLEDMKRLLRLSQIG